MLTRFSYLLLVCYFIILITACSSVNQHSIKSNLLGHVAEFKYTRMPLKGKPISHGIPLQTTLYIYEPTHLYQLEDGFVSGPTVSKIKAQLIDSVYSDSLGNFNMHLQPGKYSIFVKYKSGYYIPYFSGSEWAALFEIKSNEITKLDLNVELSPSYE